MATSESRSGSTTLPRDEALDGAEITEAAELFKAMGNPIRVHIITLIRREADKEVCFCDLAEQFDIPQSSLSHHLKILVDAGILTRQRRGTWSWYRIEHEPLDEMEGLVRAGGPLRAHPHRDPHRCD